MHKSTIIDLGAISLVLDSIKEDKRIRIANYLSEEDIQNHLATYWSHSDLSRSLADVQRSKVNSAINPVKVYRMRSVTLDYFL